ncbi:uncharacterized protein KY384_006415 [Bacidia gigantensis]|uniref:uncharacterized protein n=1 Tax=Bacidia gigantensis TaxID=2732470 RepID=UPI001D054268|nr:uncharacterized protein KY384_006415 [Bacidia gigantensis]KAG8528728.1 hypothetical protein KY384_006415 [Bacidia gigantensis]
MADITDPNNHSPDLGDATGNGNGAEARGVKRPRVSAAADDDDDDDDKPGRERRKIDIKFIQDKSRRHITFSKRKAGIMKKACLNAPEPASGNENGVDAEQEDSAEDVSHAQMQAPQANMPRGGSGGMPQYISPAEQQQMAYQQYMQQQSQGIGGQYPMPPRSNRRLYVATSIVAHTENMTKRFEK